MPAPVGVVNPDPEGHLPAMKVLLSSTRFPGSLYYRAAEPARAVNEAGLGVEVTLTYGLATTMDGPASEESSTVISVDAQGADVVVLQLPKTKAALEMLRLLQAQGVASWSSSTT